MRGLVLRAAGLQGCRAAGLLAAGVCCVLAEGLRAAGGIMGCQIGIFSPYSTTVVGWLPGYVCDFPNVPKTPNAPTCTSEQYSYGCTYQVRVQCTDAPTGAL
jgi:hypothetical protein